MILGNGIKFATRSRKGMFIISLLSKYNECGRLFLLVKCQVLDILVSYIMRLDRLGRQGEAPLPPLSS